MRLRPGAIAAFSVGVAAALVSLGPPARAIELGEGVHLDLTETFYFDYHSVLDDAAMDPPPENVFQLKNRLNALLRWRTYTLGMRLDAALFPNPPSEQYRSDLTLERLFAKARWGKLTLTLGDSYLTYGQGMVVAARKEDDLGYEVSLRGVHADWRVGWLRARLSAGLTNVTNVDGVDEKLVPDPLDVLATARLEAGPVRWLKLAAHVVDIERRNSSVRAPLAGVFGDSDTDFIDGAGAVRTLMYGGSLEVPDLADTLSFFVEANALGNTDVFPTLDGERQERSRGLAIYGKANGFFGPVSILAEAKHYDHWSVRSSLHPDTAGKGGITQDFPYVKPPTLERIDEIVYNNTDVTGGRLRADVGIADTGSTVFAAAGWIEDTPEAGDTRYRHIHLGWEHHTDANDRLQVQAGYRVEDDLALERATLEVWRLDGDLYFLAGSEAFQAHVKHEFITADGGTPLEDAYVKGTAYVTWQPHHAWSFTPQFEYFTSDKARTTWFPGLWVTFRIDQGSVIRLFAGRSLGGIKCAGGICREFPDFEGVRLDATLRF